MPKKFVRFAIRNSLGFRSSEWLIVWSTKNSDVYIMSRVMGGVFKASLHQSGRCHVKAPDPTKWQGRGSAPKFLDSWAIDRVAPFVYPFGIIIPSSELRAVTWSKPHSNTIWLKPTSSATEIAVFLTHFSPSSEQLADGGWNRILGQAVLPDGRHLSVVVGNPELPEHKANELAALKSLVGRRELSVFGNPRLILVAGEGDGTRHFIEAAVS